MAINRIKYKYKINQQEILQANNQLKQIKIRIKNQLIITNNNKKMLN